MAPFPSWSILTLLLAGCGPGGNDDGKAPTGETGGTETGDTDSADSDMDTGDTDMDTGDTDTDTDSGDTGTDTDFGDTDTDTGDTDTDTDSGDTDTDTDTDSGDTDTAWSGRDTADTGAETGVTDSGCDRDDCSDTARDTSGVDTGEVCDRDEGCDTADTSGSGDTGASGSDTGEVCDVDTGCGDTSSSPSDDTGDTAADTADPADTADTTRGDTGADTGDTGESEDEGGEILVATYADWTAGTGWYTVWEWPSGTEIVADVALAQRDNMVDCDDDQFFLLARNTGVDDSLTALDPATGALGDTWSLGADAYPWDVDRIDGVWWVSAAAECRIDVFDDAGALTETIDLSAWADSDGTCRPASLWEDGSTTYVVLSGDDTDPDVGTPQLLALDTATRTVDWTLSLSGSLVSSVGGHRVGDRVYVQNAGTYTYGMSVTPNLDGGFEIVDLSTGSTSGYVLAEADLGARFDGFAPIDGTATGWLLMTDDATGIQTVEFADLDAGTVTNVFTVSGVTARRLTPEDDGTFWVLEEDESTGVELSAWVHRDASFAELERFDLGEDLFQMRICQL